MKTLKLKKMLVALIFIVFINSSIIIAGSSYPKIKNELNSYLQHQTNLNINENGDILYVGGNGPGNYSNLQDAIDNANQGDTIFVYSGLYPAEIVVDKSLTIVGEDRDDTIIRGGRDGFFIYADNVKITNLTIMECGAGWSHAAIQLISNDNTLTNIKIIDNGKLNGLFLKDSNNNIISNNYIENNPYHAIRMEYSNYNTFKSNYINNNQADGLFMADSSNNYFELNTISLSFWAGITIDEYCENNILIHNNLINNGQNANDNGRNIWNNSYPSGGNYWSDYVGMDEFQGPEQDIPGSDGIGDTPYDLPCEHAIDWYPLMKPFSEPFPPVITGQINGKVGVEYNYNFFVDDPDNDDLYLRVDWGTGSTSKWYGPYPSGSNVQLKYTWNEKGTFLIKGQVKDTHEVQGEWGTLEVVMPRDNCQTFYLHNQLLTRLFSKIVEILDFLTIIF